MQKEMIKCTPIKALRLLTGMFDPDHAVTILAMVNLLARKLDNCELLEDSFLVSQFAKAGIELDLTGMEKKDE